MSDAKWFMESAVSGDVSPPDIRVTAGDVVHERGLETCVLLSLFSDARADENTQGVQTLGGYWGSEIAGFAIGSQVWTYARKAISKTDLRLFEQDVEGALAWMVEDGIAQSVSCAAALSRPGGVSFVVTIRRPSGDDIAFRYAANWDAQTSGVEVA